MAIIEMKKDGRYGRDYECILKYYRDGMTLAEIAYEYNLSRERIRQLIARGLRGMKAKANIRYLIGEADIIPSRVVNKNTDTVSSQVANRKDDTGASCEATIEVDDSDIPFYNSLISEDAISISRLVSELLKNGIIEKRLQYENIMQWFYSVGDINVYEEHGRNIYVPTEQGNLHGIKRGIGKTVEGKPFLGILLEPIAQKYIRDNLGEILNVLGE